jgi:cyclophilin family peptidyl-prolyl cis-trans isomerase
MKHISFLFVIALLVLGSCSNEPEQVVITTDMGEIVVKLYNSTPKHRDNFLKLVDEGYYDGTLFHRVIKGFMVQAGDPDSKNATPESLLGNGGPEYTLQPEFKEVHTRGALAAARKGDAVNPYKESSGSQFYIVHGSPVTESILTGMENLKGVTYTQEQKEKYIKEGGTPMLDNEYTVFGEVVSGMDVVDKIAEVERGVADRPLKDIRITSVKRLK